MNQRGKFMNIAMLLIVVTSISACSTYYYYPTNQHVLEFKEKGDLHAAYGIDAGCSTYSLGYSITNHMALASDLKKFDKAKTGHWFWDNELILYKRYDQRKGYVIPAVNIGYGFGKINKSSELYHLDVSRQFVQPSIGYKNNVLELALALRVTRVDHDLHEGPSYNMYNANGNGVQSPEEIFGLYDVGKRPFYFAEPSFMVGLGYKAVRLRWQYINAERVSSGNIKYVDKTSFLTLNVTFNISKP